MKYTWNDNKCYREKQNRGLVWHCNFNCITPEQGDGASQVDWKRAQEGHCPNSWLWLCLLLFISLVMTHISVPEAATLTSTTVDQGFPVGYLPGCLVSYRGPGYICILSGMPLITALSLHPPPNSDTGAGWLGWREMLNILCWTKLSLITPPDTYHFLQAKFLQLKFFP